jgi:hypothetical protein
MKSKDTKRKEAVERQKEYDSLSDADKLVRASKRPGLSRREVKRVVHRFVEDNVLVSEPA